MEDPETYPIHAALSVPLDHTQIGWIGLLAIMWSQFEFMVEAAIYHLRSQTWEEGRASDLPDNISKRLGILQALAGDKLIGTDRKLVLEICRQGGVAAPLRNIAIHGQWVPHRPDNEVKAVSWFRVVPGEPLATVEFSDLPRIAEDTATLGRCLYEFFQPRGAFAAMEV